MRFLALVVLVVFGVSDDRVRDIIFLENSQVDKINQREMMKNIKNAFTKVQREQKELNSAKRVAKAKLAQKPKPRRSSNIALQTRTKDEVYTQLEKARKKSYQNNLQRKYDDLL